MLLFSAVAADRDALACFHPSDDNEHQQSADSPSPFAATPTSNSSLICPQGHIRSSSISSHTLHHSFLAIDTLDILPAPKG